MEILQKAIKIAEKAGKLILKESQETIHISEKGTNDFVTNVDQASEELIIAEIHKHFPDHAILAEESASTLTDTDAEYIWIIDPIDGTLNFTHAIPYYSVSIAVLKIQSSKHSKNYDYLSGELIAGVVHAPALGETFYAAKGKGAYFNGQKIQVSKAKTLKKSITATGFPSTNKEMNLPYYSKMLEKTQGIRRFGSAALDLCYIACGRLDIFWEFSLSPWDIAAGSLIVEEAGGSVSDTNGNMLDLFGKDILATNGKVHKATIASFKNL